MIRRPSLKSLTEDGVYGLARVHGSIIHISFLITIRIHHYYFVLINMAITDRMKTKSIMSIRSI